VFVINFKLFQLFVQHTIFLLFFCCLFDFLYLIVLVQLIIDRIIIVIFLFWRWLSPEELRFSIDLSK